MLRAALIAVGGLIALAPLLNRIECWAGTALSWWSPRCASLPLNRSVPGALFGLAVIGLGLWLHRRDLRRSVAG
jgi:hypothetical protein